MTLEFTPAGFDAFQNNITEVSTVRIGTALSTGTANQALQVGTATTQLGAYISGNLGIGTTNPISKLHVVGDSFFDGIIYGNVVGSITTTGLLLNNIIVTGLTTIPNGPVLIGSTSVTGTASQLLQVTGGAYVSGSLGIGTTNPSTPLQIETYGVKTGIGTFNASVGVSTAIDSFSVSSDNFKTAEYTVHIGFGTYIQAQKVLVMQDQSTAYVQEYSVMYNNSLLVSIGATISGQNCILQVTPQTGISGLTTYRFTRETML